MTKTQINPGYGYRLLKQNERVIAGDEYLSPRLHDGWRASSNYLPQHGGRQDSYPYRRKIDVGVGFRLVGENETLKVGDEVCSTTGFWFPIQGPSIGSTPAAQNWKFAVNCVARRRNAPPPTTPFDAAQAILNTVRANLKTPDGESLCAHAKHVADKLEQTQQALDRAEDALDTAAMKLTNTEAALSAAKLEIANGRTYSDKQTKEIFELKAKIASMEKNASGNAVLVSKDGFSLPHVAPSAIINGVETMPSRSTLTGYGTVLQFQRTENKDGFGRVIYREVA